MVDAVSAATVLWLRRLTRREAIQLLLYLSDAGQLRLEFPEDLIDLRGEAFHFAIGRWSRWSRWTSASAWTSGTDFRLSEFAGATFRGHPLCS